MHDLISRQAAIDAIEEYSDRLQMVNWKEYPNVPYKAYALNWCINTIRDLPSAQTERKKGQWILKPNIYGVAYCSECDYELHTDNTNYCPNCGARMEEEE